MLVSNDGCHLKQNEYVPVVCLTHIPGSISPESLTVAIDMCLSSHNLYEQYIKQYGIEMMTTCPESGLFPFMKVATKYSLHVIYDFLRNKPCAMSEFGNYFPQLKH